MRPSLAARVARIAVPTVVAGVVAAGVVAAVSPGQSQVAYPAPLTVVTPTADSAIVDRHSRLSRASSRPSLSAPPSAPLKTASTKAKAPTMAKPAKAAKPLPALKAVDTMYTRVDLNLRTQPTDGADVIGVVKTGGKVSVTKAVRNGYRYVAYNGSGRWVKDKYLTDKKPAAAVSNGISGAACSSGSSVESGLTSDAIKVHRAVCAKFPQVKSYGGVRSGGGNHGSGRAVDAMISDSSVGWQVARWVQANAKRLGVSEVIYAQKIWTVQRGGEGWRSMSDRGSASANHYDHVHVSVYGSRASG